MIKDKAGIKGHIRLKLFDKDGNLKQEHEHQNTITVLMDALVADAMSDGALDAISHMAVGIVNGGKSTASTALESLIAGSPTALDSTTLGTGGDDNDVVYVCTFGAGVGTGTIIEAGLFNVAACTSGMCAYDESMDITKGAADTLEITWTVTFGAS